MDWSLTFGGDMTLSYSEGDGVADGLWLTNGDDEGMRIESGDASFGELLRGYFDENF